MLYLLLYLHISILAFFALFYNVPISFFLHSQSAWLGNEEALKVFGDGQNIVPTIHIRDLARFASYLQYYKQLLCEMMRSVYCSIVVNIADCKPRTRYLLGVDDSNNTLEEIVTVCVCVCVCVCVISVNIDFSGDLNHVYPSVSPHTCNLC